jgi:hypothetical protein
MLAAMMPFPLAEASMHAVPVRFEAELQGQPSSHRVLTTAGTRFLTVLFRICIISFHSLTAVFAAVPHIIKLLSVF